MSGQLNVLVISNIHSSISQVNRLCDYIIRHEAVDVVFVCGNFVEPTPSATGLAESMAAAEGDMTALLSRLEMIVCRVIYVPGPYDPPSTKRLHELKKSPRLTPYSINCDKITVPLTDDIESSHIDVHGPNGSDPRPMELVVEGSKDDCLVFEVRTEYSDAPDGRYNVYSKLARLPWCCRICLSQAKAGYFEWIEKGQLLLAPGWLEVGYFALITVAHRDGDDNDGDMGYEVTRCRMERLGDEIDD
ncbi:Aste57867_842 [Aphanomyces stellatus]|uniref:Aste57867_842 protein n=1 Tax=Aphanomyces stellatus TaxID=120398 RepID=A0A485K8N0_9STRA|nr:hypothetical protein As57867_000841 [Aphanomyces stellatus]VFT78066.1 Aste57867_842 [Aphanomyces stellatus]